MDLLINLAKKTGVPTKKILDLLFYMQSNDLENSELISMVGISKNGLTLVKSERKEWFEPNTHKTKLNEKGRKVVRDLLGQDYKPSEMMWSFLTESIAYKQAKVLLAKYIHLRGEPKRKYDQFFGTIHTTVLRGALLNYLEDIEGKRLLFLGDDDFTSVAVAIISKALEITVVDIDEKILEPIKQISEAENLNINTILGDARKTLTKELGEKYDIVFTDPPYTPAGIKLFLSRAIQVLDKGNKAARIYLCFGNSDLAKERFLPIQEIISQSGLYVRYVLDKFNRYNGAESIGSSSSLYICEVTPKTKPLIKDEYDQHIYTN